MKTTKEGAGREEERRYSELPATPTKTSKKDTLRRGKENREIRLLRRSKTLKEKNDPDRFSGEGMNFRAKIIGTEPVLDARGNRMCQGALQRLKAAVKTSKDHKQKIVLNISLNGIIIKDEKTLEMLHHHPIHKISFISQDTSDNRAFGYVFGCPQIGHEFFGLKTEKMASQVVLTLRDLFLTALEIKKREIESAMETQKETEDSPSNAASTNGDSLPAAPSIPSENGHNKSTLHQELLYSNTVLLPEEGCAATNGKEHLHSAEPAVDTLLDLQFTVDSLQQGISQMDHSIATVVSQNFGLSFSEDDISQSSSSSAHPSFHFKMEKMSSVCPERLSVSSRSSSTSDYAALVPPEEDQPRSPGSSERGAADFGGAEQRWTPDFAACAGPALQSPPRVPRRVQDRYAVFQDIDALPSIFDNPNIVEMPTEPIMPPPVSDVMQFSPDFDQNELIENAQEIKRSTPIVFAELDPLGNQPFVDKKDFFQDIKNPPKKVLKQLAGDEEQTDSDEFGAARFETSFESTDNTSAAYDTDRSKSPFFTAEKPASPFNPFGMEIPSNPPKLPPKKVTNFRCSFAIEQR